VVTVRDGREALQRLVGGAFDLVLSDIQMARASGIEVLEAVSRDFADTPVVLITACAEPSAAMDAIGRGAADHLAKPVDIVALRTTVARALERRRLARENHSLRTVMAGHKVLVGTSPPMLELCKAIARVAPTDASVLITGESGTGKELVARHPRAEPPRQGTVRRCQLHRPGRGLARTRAVRPRARCVHGSKCTPQGAVRNRARRNPLLRRGRRRSGQDASQAPARPPRRRSQAGGRLGRHQGRRSGTVVDPPRSCCRSCRQADA
jgi:CheY-like chemotaxis protein